MENRDLAKEFKALDIIAFDCNGLATKADVIKSLDVIKAHISHNSDEDASTSVEYLQKQKKTT